MAKKEEKVTQIIQAAVIELEHKSLDAASMHNIAEIAGVSKRTLYKYYPTKELLYDAMVNYVLEGACKMVKTEYNDQESIELQIDRIIATKTEFSLNQEYMKIMKITLAEILKGRSLSSEQSSKINENEMVLLEWISAAKKAKKIKSNLSAQTIAAQFLGVLKSQIFWPVIMGVTKIEDLDIKKIQKQTKEFFVDTFCK